ncbi:hypothetical protein [Pedobacter sandarakinus]|uniref:hypothetical protein n=1 Tax=Pedobacter sandarakinus TaxID=353156 RepID=UPI002247F538|nr:hypothetical protein [Pedobacter sandarakinus]MCX2574074.1 hypothetical protein [Pedobacter sandarakinus]
MELEIDELYTQFEQLEVNADDEEFDPNQLQDDFYILLEKVEALKHSVWDDNDLDRLDMLKSKMESFKSEQNFYDADDELNRMFPNRGDDDFDEDSTSYESVFGKD